MLKEIEEHVKRGRTVLIIASCSITYEGRISSRLEQGERIILIKQDRSVNIIQPKGVMPVNYMKEGSTITLDAEERVIRIDHPTLREHMRITLHTILDVHAYTLHDTEKITLTGTEKDMHEYIYENPHLIQPDFTPLSREEHTKYGYIDVFGYDRNGNLIVVECKRGTADYTAVTQLERYVERISMEKGIPRERVKGVLAAPSMSREAEAYLREKGFTFRQVIPPERRVRSKQQRGLHEWVGKERKDEHA